MANNTPTEFDPLPAFLELYYLARYPDILKAVEDGWHRTGYKQFLRSGARELRSPSETFDLHDYVTASGSAVPPFWLLPAAAPSSYEMPAFGHRCRPYATSQFRPPVSCSQLLGHLDHGDERAILILGSGGSARIRQWWRQSGTACRQQERPLESRPFVRDTGWTYGVWTAVRRLLWSDKSTQLKAISGSAAANAASSSTSAAPACWTGPSTRVT